MNDIAIEWIFREGAVPNLCAILWYCAIYGKAPFVSNVDVMVNRIVVPKKITVHLGKPSANVRNVTVSFQSYIANVASSEVYPTWDSAPGTQRTSI